MARPPLRNNNGLVLTSAVGSGTVALAAPGKFLTLQFLTTSQSNTTWSAVLNFADGSQTTLSNVTDPDWVGGSPNNALQNMGLVRQNSDSGYADSAYPGNLNFYEHDFALSAADQAKMLNSVTVNTVNVSGDGMVLFGLSGLQLITPATQSYANNVNVTADSTIDVSTALQATMGNLSIGSNRLSLTGTSGTQLTLGTTTLTGNAIFSPAAATTLILGPISGSAGNGIAAAGAGTLVLGSGNTYSGATAVT